MLDMLILLMTHCVIREYNTVRHRSQVSEAVIVAAIARASRPAKAASPYRHQAGDHRAHQRLHRLSLRQAGAAHADQGGQWGDVPEGSGGG